ncbi:MAG: hypothetical protein M1827_006129 [Pycnora praestabilis]|nr:MAG: hypothetical protein M1827_006129 [Pycnora praestabilis]
MSPAIAQTYFSYPESYYTQHLTAKTTRQSSKIRSTSRSRRSWPPHPMVEDEVQSLERELSSTTLSDFAGSNSGEAASTRGSIDQQPIILEVDDASQPVSERISKGYAPDPTSTKATFADANDVSNHGRGSRDAASEVEKGLGLKSQGVTGSRPTTPRNSLESSRERRQVRFTDEVAPEKLRQDDQKKEKGPDKPRGRQKEPPSLKIRPEDKETIACDKKMPSPYAYSTPTKSRYPSSSDYFASPVTLSPAASQPSFEKRTDGAYAFPTLPYQDSHPHVSEIGPNDSASNSGRRRTKRPSFVEVEKPRITHESSVGYPKDKTIRPEREVSFSQALPLPVVPQTSYLRTDVYPQTGPRSRPGSRHASPTVSPKVSPNSSPAGSPHLDATRYSQVSRPGSSSGSRSSSPLMLASPQPPRPPGLDVRRDGRTESYPPMKDYHSGQTYNLAVPPLEQPSAQDGPRIDIQGPSPLSHERKTVSRSQSSYTEDSCRRSSSRQPSPHLLSRHESIQLPEERDRRPSPHSQPRLPPRSISYSNSQEDHRPSQHTLHPRSPSFTVPVERRWGEASHQSQTPTTRYPQSTGPPSQQFESLSRLPGKFKIAPLPPCPRSEFIEGYNDWYTLSGSSTFDICPSCFKSVIEPTRYGSHFTRALPRSLDIQVRCDFSLPWVRFAWLLTHKQQRLKLDLVYAAARVAANEQDCPGKEGAIRSWYALLDPDTRHPIRNFDACPCCIKSLEALLPPLRGAFVQITIRDGPLERTCDLRFDSKRFPGYVDLLEATADKAMIERRAADIRQFTDLARRQAMIRECTRDDPLQGQPWHFIPQLPEFTVCEDCFNEAVWPAITAGSSLASRFNQTLQLIGSHHQEFSCQLYSPRMRKVFQQAVERNDLGSLSTTARKRYSMEKEVQGRQAELLQMKEVVSSRLRHHSHHYDHHHDSNGASVGQTGGMDEKWIDKEFERVAMDWKNWE